MVLGRNSFNYALCGAIHPQELFWVNRGDPPSDSISSVHHGQSSQEAGIGGRGEGQGEEQKRD